MGLAGSLSSRLRRNGRSVHDASKRAVAVRHEARLLATELKRSCGSPTVTGAGAGWLRHEAADCGAAKAREVIAGLQAKQQEQEREARIAGSPNDTDGFSAPRFDDADTNGGTISREEWRRLMSDNLRLQREANADRGSSEQNRGCGSP